MLPTDVLLYGLGHERKCANPCTVQESNEAVCATESTIRLDVEDHGASEALWESTTKVLSHVRQLRSLTSEKGDVQKLSIGAPEEVHTSIFQDVMILDRKISQVENELHDAIDEMRMLTVERRKTEANGLRCSDTAGTGVGCEAVSEARGSGTTSGTWASSGLVLA